MTLLCVSVDIRMDYYCYKREKNFLVVKIQSLEVKLSCQAIFYSVNILILKDILIFAQMDEKSDEIHYLNEAIKECTSLSNSIEATIDFVQKLSLKYNKNYDFPFNPSDDKQYNSIIATHAKLKTAEEADDSLCNLSDDISFTTATTTGTAATTDDFVSNESGTSTPASSSTTSRNSSRSRLSLKSIKLYRTPSDIVQSQNDIRVKMIKIRRAFEDVGTSFERIKQKYGTGGGVVAKKQDYFFAKAPKRSSPLRSRFLYEKHLQRLQRIFMAKY